MEQQCRQPPSCQPHQPALRQPQLVTALPKQAGAAPSTYTKGMAFSMDLTDHVTWTLTLPTTRGQVCCLCTAGASHLDSVQVMLNTFAPYCMHVGEDTHLFTCISTHAYLVR